MARDDDDAARHAETDEQAEEEAPRPSPPPSDDENQAKDAASNRPPPPPPPPPPPRTDTTTTTRRKPRPAKDPDAPKRPLSAYNLFFMDVRSIIMNGTVTPWPSLSSSSSYHWPTTGTGGYGGGKGRRKRAHRKTPGNNVGFNELTKIVLKRWREANSETRRVYEARSVAERERYEEEMRRYFSRKRHQWHQNWEEGVGRETQAVPLAQNVEVGRTDADAEVEIGDEAEEAEDVDSKKMSKEDIERALLLASQWGGVKDIPTSAYQDQAPSSPSSFAAMPCESLAALWAEHASKKKKVESLRIDRDAAAPPIHLGDNNKENAYVVAPQLNNNCSKAEGGTSIAARPLLDGPLSLPSPGMTGDGHHFVINKTKGSDADAPSLSSSFATDNRPVCGSAAGQPDRSELLAPPGGKSGSDSSATASSSFDDGRQQTTRGAALDAAAAGAANNNALLAMGGVRPEYLSALCSVFGAEEVAGAMRSLSQKANQQRRRQQQLEQQQARQAQQRRHQHASAMAAEAARLRPPAEANHASAAVADAATALQAKLAALCSEYGAHNVACALAPLLKKEDATTTSASGPSPALAPSDARSHGGSSVPDSSPSGDGGGCSPSAPAEEVGALFYSPYYGMNAAAAHNLDRKNGISSLQQQLASAASDRRSGINAVMPLPTLLDGAGRQMLGGGLTSDFAASLYQCQRMQAVAMAGGRCGANMIPMPPASGRNRENKYNSASAPFLPPFQQARSDPTPRTTEAFDDGRGDDSPAALLGELLGETTSGTDSTASLTRGEDRADSSNDAIEASALSSSAGERGQMSCRDEAKRARPSAVLSNPAARREEGGAELPLNSSPSLLQRNMLPLSNETGPSPRSDLGGEASSPRRTGDNTKGSTTPMAPSSRKKGETNKRNAFTTAALLEGNFHYDHLSPRPGGEEAAAKTKRQKQCSPKPEPVISTAGPGVSVQF